MENTVTPVISGSAIDSLRDTLSANITAIAPNLFGLAAVILVPYVIYRLYKKFAK